jgi:hypothetical protein
VADSRQNKSRQKYLWRGGSWYLQHVKFEGVKDSKAELPDPYALTYLKPGYEKLDFKLP